MGHSSVKQAIAAFTLVKIFIIQFSDVDDKVYFALNVVEYIINNNMCKDHTEDKIIFYKVVTLYTFCIIFYNIDFKLIIIKKQ